MSELSVFTGQDWHVQLERHIHSRTHRRLNRLEIRRERNHAVVHGQAPSYYVRQLAEQAALEIVPADRLLLVIQVESPAVHSRTSGTVPATRSAGREPALVG